MKENEREQRGSQVDRVVVADAFEESRPAWLA